MATLEGFSQSKNQKPRISAPPSAPAEPTLPELPEGYVYEDDGTGGKVAVKKAKTFNWNDINPIENPKNLIWQLPAAGAAKSTAGWLKGSGAPRSIASFFSGGLIPAKSAPPVAETPVTPTAPVAPEPFKPYVPPTEPPPRWTPEGFQGPKGIEVPAPDVRGPLSAPPEPVRAPEWGQSVQTPRYQFEYTPYTPRDIPGVTPPPEGMYS